MLAYEFRRAWQSLRQTPVLSTLMVSAIGLGVGVSMTTLSIYHLMSANPIPYKSDQLFAVTMDGWDVDEGWDEEDFPGLPPWELTWRDAMALRESTIPTHHAAMFTASAVVQPDSPDINPFLTTARATDAGFFALFDVPFLFGGAWDAKADERGEQVVVLSRETNEKVFGGEDSVGREILLSDRRFRVAGVIADWNPVPKYYDVNNGAFNDAEDLFFPISLTRALELSSMGNVNCWKRVELDTFDAFLQSECVWVQYWAQLDDRAQRENYQDFIDAYVGEQKALGRFERPLNNRLTDVDEWLETRRVVRDDSRVLLGLSFMFLAVCVFNTVGLLLAKFIGKAPQVSLLRALGASRWDIFRQHIIEVGIIGLTGGALGLGLAWLGLRGIRLLSDGSQGFTYLDTQMLLTGVGIAIAASLVAGLLPTWRVCNMSPAPFLRTQ